MKIICRSILTYVVLTCTIAILFIPIEKVKTFTGKAIVLLIVIIALLGPEIKKIIGKEDKKPLTEMDLFI